MVRAVENEAIVIRARSAIKGDKPGSLACAASSKEYRSWPRAVWICFGQKSDFEAGWTTRVFLLGVAGRGRAWSGGMFAGGWANGGIPVPGIAPGVNGTGPGPMGPGPIGPGGQGSTGAGMPLQTGIDWSQPQETTGTQQGRS